MVAAAEQNVVGGDQEQRFHTVLAPRILGPKP